MSLIRELSRVLSTTANCDALPSESAAENDKGFRSPQVLAKLQMTIYFLS
jgi:hypothetical protein